MSDDRGEGFTESVSPLISTDLFKSLLSFLSLVFNLLNGFVPVVQTSTKIFCFVVLFREKKNRIIKSIASFYKKKKLCCVVLTFEKNTRLSVNDFRFKLHYLKNIIKK